jgi:hypothetical protein
MAHATHADDYSPEEALREIQSERSRRSWLALFLFVLCGAAAIAAFYLSYRDVPAPATPANGTPALLEPYH